jgi:uncharacterized oxidoreductase
MELKGKNILITGGSAGLGLESAKQFLSEGAKVIITGRNQAKLDKAKQKYPALTIINSDVADADGARSLFEQVKALGGIEILYNNAGVGTQPLNLAKANEQHFEDAAYEMNVNYLGVMRLTNLFIDMLKAKPEAAIINTTSVLSYVPALVAPTYSASKAALRFYTESLRKHLEILGSSVKVFELLPPLVETEMTASLNEKKMTTEDVIAQLVSGIKKDRYTVRVGATKLLYTMNRLFPATAFGMLNQKKMYSLLQ